MNGSGSHVWPFSYGNIFQKVTWDSLLSLQALWRRTLFVGMYAVNAFLSIPSMVAISIFALTFQSAATTIIYPRSQDLGGWHERTFTTTWSDLEPDEKVLVSIDSNGDLRGFDGPTTTVWLQSPVFILGAASSITIAQIYLMANSEAAPATIGDVSGTKSPTGWAGIALIDGAGNFVRTYSAATEWQAIEFTSGDLAGLEGEELTLNFISMNNSSGDFLYVNRPITINGAIPEPSAMLLGCASLVLLWRRRRVS